MAAQIIDVNANSGEEFGSIVSPEDVFPPQQSPNSPSPIGNKNAAMSFWDRLKIDIGDQGYNLDAMPPISSSSSEAGSRDSLLFRRRPPLLDSLISPKATLQSPDGESIAAYLATFVPNIVIRHHFEHPEPCDQLVCNRLEQAYVLFCDISGFSTLTNKHRMVAGGFETVASLINQYFTQLTKLILSYQGDVIKIAGDALLCLFTEKSYSEAIFCALEIQRRCGSFQQGDVSLSLHIGLTIGEVCSIHIGGVDGRWEHLLMGPALKTLGNVVKASDQGQVCVTKELWDVSNSDFDGHLLVVEEGEEIYEITGSKAAVFAPPSPSLEIDGKRAVSILNAIRSYAPLCVQEQLDAGFPSFIGTRRTVSCIFCTLPAFDQCTEAKNLSTLSEAFIIMQSCLYRWGGVVRQFLVDDKGVVFIGVFGVPPFSNEDDPARAVFAATAMCSMLKEQLQLDAYAGVTTGLAFTGIVGAPQRREYAMVGHTINMAARLMSKAMEMKVPVLSDHNTATSQHCITITALQFGIPVAVVVKGSDEPILAYTATPLNNPRPESQRASYFSTQITQIGRESECELLRDSVSSLRSGHRSGAIIIEGEAGSGKSTLVQCLRWLVLQDQRRSSAQQQHPTLGSPSNRISQVPIRNPIGQLPLLEAYLNAERNSGRNSNNNSNNNNSNNNSSIGSGSSPGFTAKMLGSPDMKKKQCSPKPMLTRAMTMGPEMHGMVSRVATTIRPIRCVAVTAKASDRNMPFKTLRQLLVAALWVSHPSATTPSFKIPDLINQARAVSGVAAEGSQEYERVMAVLNILFDLNNKCPATNTERDALMNFELHSVATLISVMLGMVTVKNPLLLVLEDCHRLDVASCNLLLSIVRACPERTLIVLTTRPTRYDGSLTFGRDVHSIAWRCIHLGPLSENESQQLMQQSLGLPVSNGVPLPPGLIDAMRRFAHGNPLLIGAFALLLKERGIVSIGSGQLQFEEDALNSVTSIMGDCPTMQALVVPRYDRLHPTLQAILGVASVWGERFTPYEIVAVALVPMELSAVVSSLYMLASSWWVEKWESDEDDDFGIEAIRVTETDDGCCNGEDIGGGNLGGDLQDNGDDGDHDSPQEETWSWIDAQQEGGGLHRAGSTLAAAVAAVAGGSTAGGSRCISAISEVDHEVEVTDSVTRYTFNESALNAWRFHSPLQRDVVYNIQPCSTTREIHWGIAELMSVAGGTDSMVADIAHHRYFACNPPDPSIPTDRILSGYSACIEAGEQAQKLAQWREVQKHVSRAQQLYLRLPNCEAKAIGLLTAKLIASTFHIQGSRCKPFLESLESALIKHSDQLAQLPTIRTALMLRYVDLLCDVGLVENAREMLTEAGRSVRLSSDETAGVQENDEPLFSAVFQSARIGLSTLEEEKQLLRIWFTSSQAQMVLMGGHMVEADGDDHMCSSSSNRGRVDSSNSNKDKDDINADVNDPTHVDVEEDDDDDDEGGGGGGGEEEANTCTSLAQCKKVQSMLEHAWKSLDTRFQYLKSQRTTFSVHLEVLLATQCALIAALQGQTGCFRDWEMRCVKLSRKYALGDESRTFSAIHLSLCNILLWDKAQAQPHIDELRKGVDAGCCGNWGQLSSALSAYGRLGGNGGRRRSSASASVYHGYQPPLPAPLSSEAPHKTEMLVGLLVQAASNPVYAGSSGYSSVWLEMWTLFIAVRGISQKMDEDKEDEPIRTPSNSPLAKHVETLMDRTLQIKPKCTAPLLSTLNDWIYGCLCYQSGKIDAAKDAYIQALHHADAAGSTVVGLSAAVQLAQLKDFVPIEEQDRINNEHLKNLQERVEKVGKCPLQSAAKKMCLDIEFARRCSGVEIPSSTQGEEARREGLRITQWTTGSWSSLQASIQAAASAEFREHEGSSSDDDDDDANEDGSSDGGGNGGDEACYSISMTNFQGQLCKRASGIFKNWNQRWVICDHVSLKWFIFEVQQQSSIKLGKCKGDLDLKSIIQVVPVHDVESQQFCFEVVLAGGKKALFSASGEQERSDWIESIMSRARGLQLPRSKTLNVLF